MMLFAHGPSSTPPPPDDYRPAAHMDPVAKPQQQQQHQHQHRVRRKRKADTQDTNNERLSKRLSLLNLGMSFPNPSASARLVARGQPT